MTWVVASLLAVMTKAQRHVWLGYFLRRSIAAQVRALREQRGWTKSQLARRAKLSYPTIILIEAKGWLGAVSTLCKIAAAFDVALTVRFSSWGDLVVTASQAVLVPASFNADPAFKKQEPPDPAARPRGG